MRADDGDESLEWPRDVGVWIFVYSLQALSVVNNALGLRASVRRPAARQDPPPPGLVDGKNQMPSHKLETGLLTLSGSGAEADEQRQTGRATMFGVFFTSNCKGTNWSRSSCCCLSKSDLTTSARAKAKGSGEETKYASRDSRRVPGAYSTKSRHECQLTLGRGSSNSLSVLSIDNRL